MRIFLPLGSGLFVIIQNFQLPMQIQKEMELPLPECFPMDEGLQQGAYAPRVTPYVTTWVLHVGPSPLQMFSWLNKIEDLLFPEEVYTNKLPEDADQVWAEI
ncbi:hypothetical protein A0H81_10399 [Grifola frondosa]|uniref:Uncharacterized protein n=1 Tax=Grifola frondosa TaxID=5627 RepID=A0A1C7M0Y2_GRIFR|nr:hypothetical protein A0H81_10399 [Grifola frondosa]